MLRVSLRLVVLVCVATVCACAHERLVTGENSTGCAVNSRMDARGVLASCGLPDGFLEQPKIGGGGGFSFELCSAPAYTYSGDAVLFGCDGKVSSIEKLDPTRYQGMIAAPTSYLLEDIKRGGTHRAARIVQLHYQKFESDDEIRTLQQVLSDAEASDDPFVKRAAQRIRAKGTVRVNGHPVY